MLQVLLPSIARHDAAIFHMQEYVPAHAGLPPAFIWPPAIDPLTPKNMALSAEDAEYIVDQFGIDVERPLLTQVSRFDPWKDPLGVIDAYREVKERFPEVQLALVGSMAHDDPEGWDYYNRTVEYADGDPDVYILSNMNNIGAVEVNAFQVHSAAVLQKSTREGFGLTVTEALWKTRPTVAGRVGVKISLDTLNRLSEETPVLVDLKPSGEHYMEDLFAAGGVGAVLRELQPQLHLDCLTVTGQTLRDRLATENGFVDRSVIRSAKDPFQSVGGLVALFGSLAPGGAILKRSAADARLFETEGKFVGEAGLNPESIRDNWDAIANPAGQHQFFGGGEQVEKIFRKLKGG